MALTMLCDICNEPCSGGYHLVSVAKGQGPLAGVFLNLGTAQRLAVCRRCGPTSTIAQLAQLRGVAFPADVEAATV